MAVSIIINGILGRMGREIARIIAADSKTTCVGGIEMPGHSAMGSDIGAQLGIDEIKGVVLSASLSEVEARPAVVIDFTAPAVTCALLEEIKGTDTRIVIGTTGLSDKDMRLVQEVSRKTAVFFSPNMSVGVNFLFQLTKLAAEKLGNDFDIEIIETHHHFKKDSPSGTAKRLGEIVAKAINTSYDESVRNGRDGIVGERGRKEIGMHAVRGGDIAGEHTVLFAGMGERIELKHCAHSRSNFAQGAVTAAKWLCDKPAGLYSMQDMLHK
jgi:4-hydroxy-tetrahydrodipicolinate reductase